MESANDRTRKRSGLKVDARLAAIIREHFPDGLMEEAARLLRTQDPEWSRKLEDLATGQGREIEAEDDEYPGPGMGV